ncbi:hypothetical protein HYU21_04270 [Candidatus Woesearchaeota archaeon]|nr:hypothetical protein [Candidatus Woesearchaeota archaeon]
MDLESQTLDLSERLRKLSDQHRDYATMDRLDALPSSAQLAEQLTTALVEIGEDKKYAGLAALITSAQEGDARYENLAPLGHALTLAAESQAGFTHEVEKLSEAVKYLLAHNGYVPLSATGEYDFFVNEDRSLVFALGTGADMYAVRVKSKGRIDECINDFNNVKRGTTDNIRCLQRDSFASNGFFLSLGASLVGSGIDTFVLFNDPKRLEYVIDHLTNYQNHLHFSTYENLPILTTTLAIGTSLLVGGIFGMFNVAKNYKKKIKEAQANVPFQSVNSGIDALVAAFPLAVNPAIITETEEIKNANSAANPNQQAVARAQVVVSEINNR